MQRSFDFRHIISRLLDEKQPFPPQYLHTFSDLEPGYLKALLEAWPDVGLTRKRAILEDLQDLAEDNTLLCFDDLARALLEDDDPQVRTRAISLLWECDRVDLAASYLKMMELDPDTNVKAAAATALGKFVYLGEVDEIPGEILRKIEKALLSILGSKEGKLIRRRALEALGASSRKEVPGLIEKAYAQKDPDWVISALSAMGRSSDESWGKKVIHSLHNTHDPIRREAVRAAGEMRLQNALPVLLDMLEDEENPEITKQIILTLSRIGGKEAYEKISELLYLSENEEESEFLEEALENLDYTEQMNGMDLINLDSRDDEDNRCL